MRRCLSSSLAANGLEVKATAQHYGASCKHLAGQKRSALNNCYPRNTLHPAIAKKTVILSMKCLIESSVILKLPWLPGRLYC